MWVHIITYPFFHCLNLCPLELLLFDLLFSSLSFLITGDINWSLNITIPLIFPYLALIRSCLELIINEPNFEMNYPLIQHPIFKHIKESPHDTNTEWAVQLKNKLELGKGWGKEKVGWGAHEMSKVWPCRRCHVKFMTYWRTKYDLHRIL